MRIYLYNDCNESNVNLEELKEFINDFFGISDIILKDKFISTHLKNLKIEAIALQLASMRVKNVFQPFIDYTPLSGEIEFEKLRLERNTLIKGILYDGLKLLLFYCDLIPKEESLKDFFHIFITDRLIGTFSEDGRYHVRALIASNPSLISTSGIVEGPAKPKLFYKLKHQSSAMGTQAPLEIFKEQIKGQFIDYNDPNLTEVLKGYISQVLFFKLTGMPFCYEKDCRLYNAHWQSELINAQLLHGNFCAGHQNFLEKWKKDSR